MHIGSILLLISKFIISVLLLSVSLYYGGNVTFDISGRIFEMHIAVLVFFFLILMYAYSGICALCSKIMRFFRGGCSAHEKGLNYLQMAFSGILLKDLQLTEKSLAKAKKYLADFGEVPLLSWIEGQFMLARNDIHKAKAIFYRLSEKETNTALGAYSICNIALKDHSTSDAINAINSILKIYPNAHELVFQAITISLRNNLFADARKYLSAIKKTHKARIVEAIIYAAESVAAKDISVAASLCKKAFKLAPELTDNAIRYADFLAKKGEYRSARKVLLQSFANVQTCALYERYISCAKDISGSDELKLAEKIMSEVKDSWLTHFRFAEIALKNGMKQLAFRHFLAAYDIEQYDFIAQKLEKIAHLLSDNFSADSETLSLNFEELISHPVHFAWKCQHCGNESKRWQAICDHCDWIGEYKYTETATEAFDGEIESAAIAAETTTTTAAITSSLSLLSDKQ